VEAAAVEQELADATGSEDLLDEGSGDPAEVDDLDADATIDDDEAPEDDTATGAGYPVDDEDDEES
jgi:hypothetical protein